MKCYLILLTFFYSLSAFTQNLFPSPGTAFNDEVIARIDIQIDQDSLDWMLQAENQDSNHEFSASFTWDNGSEQITQHNIGFRLRGNTSRKAKKKSFKIDFTKFGGNRFFELEEMNLNGEHNDPSIVRSKVCWDLYKMAGIPSTHANHVLLYINEVYRGLYLNIEHIDKRFLKKRYALDAGNLYKCFWGADMAFRTSNADDYKHSPFGNRIYDLKTNKKEDDYTDLKQFITILNNETAAPDFQCQLESIFNVDTYLRAMAMDILVGNWDGPIFNKNNFYLYANPRTGKFEYLPYDLDNTFGIDWFGIDWSNRDPYKWSQDGEKRPIYTNILSVPAYRDRMSFYMNQFIDDFFNEDFLVPYLEDFKNRLSPHVVNDTFAIADYGFDHQDFLDSYDKGLGKHVPFGITEFIKSRINNAMYQLEEKDIAPAMSRPAFQWNDNEMIFSLQVVDNDSPNVSLHYNFNNQGWQNNISLSDDGLGADAIAGDGFYTAQVAFPGIGKVDYYFEAAAANKSSRFPYCTDLQARVGFAATSFLFINEFMADNNYSFPDEADQYDDWLEVYNGGSEAVYLGDKFLSDDHANPSKWPMPDKTLQPGEFLLFWCDEDQGQGDTHTNFKLSRSGEELGIWDSEANNYAPIDTFTYGEVSPDTPWGLYPDGVGEITNLSWRTPGYSNVPLSAKDLAATSIEVFPNPVDVLLMVQADAPISSMELIAIDGKTWVIDGAEQEQLELDFSGFAAGMYLLRVKMKEGTEQIKLLKL